MDKSNAKKSFSASVEWWLPIARLTRQDENVRLKNSDQKEISSCSAYRKSKSMFIFYINCIWLIYRIDCFFLAERLCFFIVFFSFTCNWNVIAVAIHNSVFTLFRLCVAIFIQTFLHGIPRQGCRSRKELHEQQKQQREIPEKKLNKISFCIAAVDRFVQL